MNKVYTEWAVKDGLIKDSDFLIGEIPKDHDDENIERFLQRLIVRLNKQYIELKEKKQYIKFYKSANPNALIGCAWTPQIDVPHTF